MTGARTLATRPWLAVVLVLVLALAGVGRGWAAPSGGPVVMSGIPGVAMPICHSEADGAPDPGAPGQHDCCDACALCAAVALPGAPGLAAPMRVVHVIAHAAALGWAPVLLRPRTPRLAQGPPTA